MELRTFTKYSLFLLDPGLKMAVVASLIMLCQQFLEMQCFYMYCIMLTLCSLTNEITL